MKSDLKNLASQQEIYYADNYKYSKTPSELSFVESEGVNVTIDAVTNGWSATATHDALSTTLGCALYYGDGATAPGSPITPTEQGEVACKTN